MLKLELKDNHSASLQRSHNSVKDISFKDMSSLIESEVKIGSSLFIQNSNVKPKPHRGQYYILYMQEFGLVYLFYLDTQGVLRVVYTGNLDSAVEGLYRYIASDTYVKVLKSSGKKAYRVINESVVTDGKFKIVGFNYKNKSSKVNNQVYLSLFEAINLAVSEFRKNSNNVYSVITPKGTVLFTVGK